MPRSVVLAYHAVSPSWPSTLAVSPDRFREQVEHLLNRGYGGARFSEVVRGQLPHKSFAVTFDDAYRSVVEHALPVLTELGVPATIFAPTDWVGREQPMCWPGIEEWSGGEHEAELVCADWDELRALKAAGWEIGSHTCAHPRLPELSNESVMAELERSKATCEAELGGACTSLAFPYGDVDSRVRALAGDAGYLAAATMRLGPEDPLSWPRVGVYPADEPWRFRLKTSATVARARSSRLGRLAEDARYATPLAVPPLFDEVGGALIALS